MEEKLINIKNNALPMIMDAQNKDELEEVRKQILGRNGSLTQAAKEISKIPPEDKPRFGKLINEIKNIIEDAISVQSSKFKGDSSTKKISLDITEPGIRPPLGHL